MSLLIFGCGYLGNRVGQRYLAAGKPVTAVTRSAERAAGLAARGFQTLVADVTRPETLINLPAAETVLYAVGHDRNGPPIEDVYAGGLRHVLNAYQHQARFLYISTTGVYGPGGNGSWVDEASPCEPRRPGGKASLAAELILAAHPRGSQHVILRMAGLYGPERLPLAAQVRAGESIPSDPESFLNLIHIDDAASVVLAAADASHAGRCYCVSDGHPIPRREFYEELARLLDAPPPTFAPPSAEAASQQRGGDKRIANTRLLTELPVKLQYPTFREGLAAIVSNG